MAGGLMILEHLLTVMPDPSEPLERPRTAQLMPRWRKAEPRPSKGRATIRFARTLAVEGQGRK